MWNNSRWILKFRNFQWYVVIHIMQVTYKTPPTIFAELIKKKLDNISATRRDLNMDWFENYVHHSVVICNGKLWWAPCLQSRATDGSVLNNGRYFSPNHLQFWWRFFRAGLWEEKEITFPGCHHIKLLKLAYMLLKPNFAVENLWLDPHGRWNLLSSYIRNSERFYSANYTHINQWMKRKSLSFWSESQRLTLLMSSGFAKGGAQICSFPPPIFHIAFFHVQHNLQDVQVLQDWFEKLVKYQPNRQNLGLESESF